MIIGIDGSRAFIKKRTGIEEYSYQTIKHLRDKFQNHQVVLFLRENHQVDFELPKNWSTKIIKWPRLWTQLGLSIELFKNPIDALFVPAHTVPVFHPKKTVVTIHGLEYEFVKNGYSQWEKFYMRLSIKKSCKWASEIISVSENTKKDLIDLYGVDANKISVVYEGYSRSQERNFQFPISNFQAISNDKISKNLCHSGLDPESLGFKQGKILKQVQDDKFLLFIGRIEERKNIINIIKAFEILKEKYQIPHKLILAGKPGYGYETIKNKIQETKCKQEIIELGYVSEYEKWELLKNADCFVFPTLYEGFGIPVLEAQSVGCPVVAANNSSIPEIAQQSAILTDCADPNDIADGTWKLLSDKGLKNAIIAKGLENAKRFSWEKCAREISEILVK